MTNPPQRVALTIAGSDSGGGAGIQADLKTFTRFGVFGTSVITAVTAQNTVGVRAWERVSPALVRAQIDAVAEDLRPAAIKSGMLGDADVVRAVAAGVREHRLSPYVLDPVMVATSGDRLISPQAIDVLKRVLIPRALLITPNLPEAAALLGGPIARDEDEMRAQAVRLVEQGARAVLIKGGHGEGAESVDVLQAPGSFTRLATERIATRNTHGTGCTLSSAIIGHLAMGEYVKTLGYDPLNTGDLLKENHLIF